MAQPSKYEQAAWDALQRSRPRAGTRALHALGDTTVRGAQALAARVGDAASGNAAVSRAASAVGRTARRAADAVPRSAVQAVNHWGAGAAESAERALAAAARVGLTPERVVAKHQRHMHPVELLVDVRDLDLQQVDLVKGRAFKTYYPAVAAASGAATSFVVTGSELAVPVSAGAAAAPAGALIAGAVAADVAAVSTLASRAVGQVALAYGYDAADPTEKVFVLSVVNAGTAMSSSAKLAAVAELSVLTQHLYRGATWKVMDSTVARLYTQFATRFGVRYTKQGLGKLVPGLGIAIGASFNWATLEGIVDAADLAYRRRFLLDKYPFLADDARESAAPEPDVAETPDVEISVLGELAQAGGPDLREP